MPEIYIMSLIWLCNRPGLWLSTLTGDCIGMRDLVAYYIGKPWRTNQCFWHQVHIYKRVLYHSVPMSPRRCYRVGTLPNPLSPASVPLSPERGGGAHSLAGGWGVGGVPSPTTWGKSLALCLLCGFWISSCIRIRRIRKFWAKARCQLLVRQSAIFLVAGSNWEALFSFEPDTGSVWFGQTF